MMKFIKVLEGEIYADSAAESGKLIKIPGDISAIRGTGLLTPAGTAVNGGVTTGAGKSSSCPNTGRFIGPRPWQNLSPSSSLIWDVSTPKDASAHFFFWLNSYWNTSWKCFSWKFWINTIFMMNNIFVHFFFWVNSVWLLLRFEFCYAVFYPSPSHFNCNRARRVWNWTRTCSSLNWSTKFFFFFRVAYIWSTVHCLCLTCVFGPVVRSVKQLTEKTKTVQSTPLFLRHIFTERMVKFLQTGI